MGRTDGPPVCPACGRTHWPFYGCLGPRGGIDKSGYDQDTEQGKPAGGEGRGIAMELSKPTIHLNGTSRGELQASYEKAYRALGDAIAAVQESAPHGRDYYPQGPEAIQIAQGRHTWRLHMLEQIRRELFELFLSCEKKP